MTNLSYLSQSEQESEPDTRSGPAHEHPREPAGLDLRQVLGTLWRRKMVIIASVFIVTTLAVLAVMRATPLYVATAQLLVEKDQKNLLGLQDTIAGSGFDFYTTQTEAAVLTSHGLAEKVVDELKLMQSPLFNPELAEDRKSILSDIDVKAWIKSLIPEWLLAELKREQAGNALPLTPEQRQARLREIVIGNVIAGIEVVTDERSRVLGVRYVSEDPEVSAQVANTIAQLYISQNILRKYEDTARATDWLNQQVGELRLKLEASQQALETHRRKIGYINLEGQANILAQQLGQLSTELVRARAARAEAEARYQQIQKLLASPEGIESAGTVLDSQLIQRLREQEAGLIRQLGELRTQLREQHPQMILKESELRDLREKIRSEVVKIATNLGNELEIARIRERNTEAEEAKVRQAIEQQNEALVTLRALEADVNANNSIYQAILQRSKETGVREDGLQEPDARLISVAVPPLKPSYPRKGLIVLVAMFASLAIGIVLVFLVEHLDSGFRTPGQVERMTGIPVIGQVPKLKGWKFRGVHPQDVVVEMPGSGYSEAIRALRTNISLSAGDPVRSVLVTSSVPGEGKTALAISFARSAAKSGQRVVIVDCDMRDPSLHVGLGKTNIRGLAEYLTGKAELEELIELDEFSGAYYLTAGHFDHHIADLLGGERMLVLLSRLQQAYDLVVFDSPPVLAVSDVLALLRRADRTVFALRWGETNREAAVAALRMTLDARAEIAGIVLTQVDIRRQSSYGYGGGEYGYGNYGVRAQG